ncbi:signal recognition particle protein [Cordyceps fumosorosea ARSEF 2679]|uniref:Signal recognition particle subunit SRP72 n=1 Tax=Cordyceps fumosorosea (strain ARSEF 2679) TaxID=1081104 RepID=A0A167YD68_CORFA|nr:signal recognition particle protein [Cordyceps fumosorosea ARSEF 2679]OAA66196.1 signal recognition particle protein [Cordyceps fumosorosea ARSEF 2679]
MPQDPAAALSSLLRGASIDDHEEVLKAANLAIKADKSDILARHTKLVALLKLDRFNDAARFLAESGSALESNCILEKAYALYKSGELEEATATLKKAGLRGRSLQHIAAQVAYRAERFSEAGQIYEELLDGNVGDEENDLTINLKAVHAQAEWSGLSAPSESLRSMPDSFELCYNIACARIARGELDEATKLLQRAATLCKASDDLGEEDKEAELRPIWLQQAYVYAREGKLKEALDLYNSIGSLSNDDEDFIIVARQNRLSLEAKPANPYLLQRQMTSGGGKPENAKLFSYQSSRERHNSYLLDLDVHKSSGVQEKTHKFLQQSEQPTNSASVNSMAVVNAAAVVEGLDDRAAVRKLQALVIKRPLDVGLLLTIIQLQLRLSRKGAALSLLQTFFKRLEKEDTDAARDVRFSPGLVALAVSLMRAQGHENSAKAEFVTAANHWTKRPNASSDSLLRESGIELMRSSNPEDLKLAGSAFEKLFAEHKGSPIASAGLVASLAAVDTDKTSQHMSELPPVESLIKGINVKALIQAGVATAPSRPNNSKKRAATDDAAATERASAKSRRRRRLPKDFEEGKTPAPDPERWLSLRDRSSYRPKNKKGKKKAADSTQGGVVKEEETLGLVGGGGVRVEKAGSGGGGAAGGGGAKKKKKGKK